MDLKTVVCRVSRRTDTDGRWCWLDRSVRSAAVIVDNNIAPYWPTVAVSIAQVLLNV